MALKKNEIEEFKKKLEKMRDELTAHLRSSTADVKVPEESRGYSQHQADEGTDDFDRQLALQLSGSEMEVMRQIDRALEKIEENTYGICDLTEKPIPLKRLEALPYATTTREAQEMLEKGLITP